MNLIALMSMLSIANTNNVTTEDNYVKDHFEEGMDYLEDHATKGEEYFNKHMEEGMDYLEKHATKGEEYFNKHMEEGFDHINDKTKSDLGTKLNKAYTSIKDKIFKLFK